MLAYHRPSRCSKQLSLQLICQRRTVDTSQGKRMTVAKGAAWSVAKGKIASNAHEVKMENQYAQIDGAA